MGIFEWLFEPKLVTLNKLKEKKDINKLAKALSWELPVLRAIAAEALGKIGNSKAIDPLIKALKDESWDVRRAACYALADIKDPRAVDPLITTLKDSEGDVRSAAVRSLIKFQDYRIIDPLIAVALHDKNIYVQKVAIDSVISLKSLVMSFMESHSHIRESATISLCKINEIIRVKEERDKQEEARKKEKENMKERERPKLLEDAERNDNPIGILCENCGRVCTALGHPISSNEIPIMTQDTLIKIAWYCEKCNIIICSMCVGGALYGIGTNIGNSLCPRCKGRTWFAAVCHVKLTHAKLA